MKRFLWKHDTTWREVVIISATIVFVIALIGAAR